MQGNARCELRQHYQVRQLDPYDDGDCLGEGVEKVEALALIIAHGWCLYYLILGLESCMQLIANNVLRSLNHF